MSQPVLYVLPEAYCVVEALDVLDESLLAVLADGLADGIGSGNGAVAWDGMGVGSGNGAAAWDGVGSGDGAVTARSLEALDEVGVDSLVDAVVDLPLLPAGAATLPFELVAWRVAFAVSFAGLLGFSIAVVSGLATSVVLLVSVLAVSALASLIVAGVLEATAVSATFARGLAVFAAASGLGSWPTLWLSTTAPPMATAVMTPNAMPKWFTFFSSWL